MSLKAYDTRSHQSRRSYKTQSQPENKSFQSHYTITHFIICNLRSACLAFQIAMCSDAAINMRFVGITKGAGLMLRTLLVSPLSLGRKLQTAATPFIIMVFLQSCGILSTQPDIPESRDLMGRDSSVMVSLLATKGFMCKSSRGIRSRTQCTRSNGGLLRSCNETLAWTANNRGLVDELTQRSRACLSTP